ncbi:DUF6350 family protein [Streptomyces sp. NPDC057638]|uniref:cell division protein PerM n=1 Tax=Streptomyces sp. NPDC057638 TaxID=3346190 RepID=UPI00368EB943
MTQLTDDEPSCSPEAVLVQGGRTGSLAACAVRGATAAGLGLGAFAVLVTLVWISSPYPDSGPDGALRVAAALWLLAHGAELVRIDTFSGHPAPIGLVPLLLMVVPLWLVHRAARDAVLPDVRRARPSAGGAVTAVAGGYLLVGGAVTVYAEGGPLTPGWPGALLWPPLLTVAAATAGVWTALGRPGVPAASARLADIRVAPRDPRGAVALRAALAGTLTLVGGGALLVACSLVWHADASQDSFLHLADGWTGRLAVLLLGIALVPNAAVWAAAYALGPGFALGTGATAAPFAVDGDPSLPHFPLIAAVPGEGPGTPLNWACLALPVLAALVIARFTAAGTRAAPSPYPRPPRGRRPGGPAGSSRDTALTALLAAAVCAVLTALLTALSGGALGTGRLADFGPVWWRAGAAALLWSALIAVPAAVLMRLWAVTVAVRKRPRSAGGERPPAVRTPRSAAPGSPPAGPPPNGSGGGTETAPERKGWREGAGTAEVSASGRRPSRDPGPEDPPDLYALTPESLMAEEPEPAGRALADPVTEPAMEPARRADPDPERPWAAPVSPWPETPDLSKRPSAIRPPTPTPTPAPPARPTTTTPQDPAPPANPAPTAPANPAPAPAPARTNTTTDTDTDTDTDTTTEAGGDRDADAETAAAPPP